MGIYPNPAGVWFAKQTLASARFGYAPSHEIGYKVVITEKREPKCHCKGHYCHHYGYPMFFGFCRHSKVKHSALLDFWRSMLVINLILH